MTPEPANSQHVPNLLTGWIKGFVQHTDGLSSPLAFRMWSAIFAVGAAGRRKIWTELIPGRPIFPNLYLFLVGPPGTGKTEAIMPAGEHLRKSETARLAPNDITKQSLLDRLSKASDAAIFTNPPQTIEFHYMALVIRELSNFMNQYDSALAGILTDLFDNPPVNEESKRGRDDGKSVCIIRPGLSLLAGTATKNLGTTIHKDLWGQGFMSRVIMVYSAEQANVEWFSAPADKTQADVVNFSPELVNSLQQIGAMKGRVGWSVEAQQAANEWRLNEFEPYPRHSKLVEYTARRYLHVAKLALVSAMANLRETIELEDFLRGKMWLEGAERDMPEIFKEMSVHSDGEVLKEMHMHAWMLYSRAKQAIPYSVLAAFLYTKVAAREIPRLIEAGEAVGMLDRLAGTSGQAAMFIPKMHFGELPE